jgi:TIR domain/Protein of unknown function (DUF2510)
MMRVSPPSPAGRALSGGTVLTAFISYARRDADTVALLRTELENLRGDVWVDARLAGGQDWWDTILEAIRKSDLFVFAVSPSALASEACRFEVDYAIRLSRPVLPIEVSPVDPATLPDDLKRLQLVTYTGGDPDQIRALARALLRVPPAPDLPTPLPDPPPLPKSYGEEFRRLLSSDALTRDQQIQLTAVLKAHSADALHGDEALELLHRLRSRGDVIFEIAVEIDGFLGKRSSDGPPVGADDEMPTPEEHSVPLDSFMTEFRRLVTEKEERAAAWRQWLVSTLLDIRSGWPKFYVSPEIPDRKLRSAAEATSFGNDEEILAVVDSTGFGSAKNCVVFTPNAALSNFAGSHRKIRYDELGNSSIDSSGRFVEQDGSTILETGNPDAAMRVASLLSNITSRIQQDVENPLADRAVAAQGSAPAPTPSDEARTGDSPAVSAVSADPDAHAGWYPDPSRRFELRYWDGSHWTEHVSTGGRQAADPPVG